MTITNPEKFECITGTLGDEEVLMQLIEECAELIQAANKLRRTWKHTTPVSSKKAILMLHEEVADVAVCTEALIVSGLLDEDKLQRIWQEKINRWYNRTCKKD